MKNFILTLGFVVLSIPAFAGGSSTAGVGNPAARNCIKLGGSLQSTHTVEGDSNNCVIDEWKLWTEMDKRGLVKPHRRNSGHGPGLPNPAAVNCVDIGGEIRIKDTTEGQLGLCVVDEWDLYKAINIVNE